jgi:hypothetical protein
MKVKITNNHEPPTHLRFRLLRRCAVKTTSFRSSTCIHDRESRSPEPSSSVILHQERAIRFLRSDLRDCSLASSSSPSRPIYLFVGRAPWVVTFNTYSVRSIVVFIRSPSSRNLKSRTVSSLKSCLTHLIC